VLDALAKEAAPPHVQVPLEYVPAASGAERYWIDGKRFALLVVGTVSDVVERVCWAEPAEVSSDFRTLAP
jgi:hypothetical protein